MSHVPRILGLWLLLGAPALGQTNQTAAVPPPLPPPPTPAGIRTNISLAWDYPEVVLSGDLSFKLYTQTNVDAPRTNWLLLTNIPIGAATGLFTNTNGICTFGIELPIDFQQRFYFATASNWWGERESPRSNITNTSPVPGHVQLEIGK